MSTTKNGNLLIYFFSSNSSAKEERIELLLLCGLERWSYRKIAKEFNLKHFYRQPITSNGILISKVKSRQYFGQISFEPLKDFRLNEKDVLNKAFASSNKSLY